VTQENNTDPLQLLKPLVEALAERKVRVLKIADVPQGYGAEFICSLQGILPSDWNLLADALLRFEGTRVEDRSSEVRVHRTLLHAGNPPRLVEAGSIMFWFGDLHSDIADLAEVIRGAPFTHPRPVETANRWGADFIHGKTGGGFAHGKFQPGQTVPDGVVR
jgi:hypothetical protein